ncbi:uncharacterized protein [Physcomitrium patens]|uniref:uncharacterized protein isoform X3 n=1 Tax=Physcomitrium patens TaxID=3218 RepID=UPI000D17E479|nr:uncharacterized protein LOC112281338 isoform X3 [Physcomitrium patens]|eukprot:XP_024373500.1 uncharacterized protein LOC112281338 isoform X3 [Physcomitrella patens]
MPGAGLGRALHPPWKLASFNLSDLGKQRIAETNGYARAEFKSFSNRQEAEHYMGQGLGIKAEPSMEQVPAMSEPSSKRLKKSTSSGTVRPSIKIEAPDTTGVSQDQADDVYQIEYDGASKGNPGPAGAGALVRGPDGSVFCELREGLGSVTNNVAEYRAFILGLKGALDRGIYRVRVQGDSKLVCQQVLGKWKVNDEGLLPLWKEAQMLMLNFREISVKHVRFNPSADQLANEAVSLPETKFVSSFPGLHESPTISIKIED